MQSFRHVLVPIDFSTCSLAALPAASAIARGGDAELTLLHVYPYGSTLDPVGAPYIPHVPRMGERTREAVISGLSRTASSVRPQVRRLRLVLREGDPSAEILHFAERQDVDLIAMGTHGRRGFDRLVLGSVTERVCQKASCSVLAVREDPEVPPPPAGAEGILCAVDLGSASRATLDVAVALAQTAGARLTLVHVVAASRRDDRSRLERPEEPDYLPASPEVYERLARLLENAADPTFEADIVIAYGRRHDEIARIARQREAALLVVGTTGDGAAEHGRFGTTVQELLRRAPCPVVLARPRSSLTIVAQDSREELLKA